MTKQLVYMLMGLPLCLYANIKNIDSTELLQTTNMVEQAKDTLNFNELKAFFAYADSILAPKDSFLTDAQIESYLQLSQKDLPQLGKTEIQQKLKEIPTNITLRHTPEIEKKIHSYLYRYRKHISKMLTKAQFYFPQFEEALDRKNMPLELKYLAVIESHLNPTAKSPMGATGLWQFMYATAKHKGFEMTSLVDERMHPQISTQLALEYLEELYTIYDDWLLALSAYNAGPGNVNKAIRAANGVKNYWIVRPYLPLETQMYIPKFIATMYAMHYAEDYFLHPKEIALFSHEIDSVKIYDKLSLKYIAELLGETEQTIYELNPMLIKKIVPKRAEGFSLIIPKNKWLVFEEKKGFFYNDPYLAIEKIEQEEKAVADYRYGAGTGKYFHYTIESGDNLGYIAEKFNCKISDIKRWNGLSSNFLRVGKKLRIYGSKVQIAESKSNSNHSGKVGYSAEEIQLNACTCIAHKIVEGDNLWDIAMQYNTSIEKIKVMNNIPPNWRLRLGVYLKIPQ